MTVVRRLTGLRGGVGAGVVARAVELSGSITVLFLVSAGGRQAGAAGSLNGTHPGAMRGGDNFL